MFHGFILAFSLILPLGIQNVFIFNQGAIQKKIYNAFPAIITAALCDTLLIYLAVTGVSLIVLKVPLLKFFLVGIGSGFIIYLGWLTWQSSSDSIASRAFQSLSTKKQIVFACSVSLLNPHAIIDTIGVIGTTSLSYEGEEKVIFALAAIVVSWFWFLLLAMVGNLTGKIDKTGKLLNTINKVSAVIMWIAALYLLTTVL